MRANEDIINAETVRKQRIVNALQNQHIDNLPAAEDLMSATRNSPLQYVDVFLFLETGLCIVLDWIGCTRYLPNTIQLAIPIQCNPAYEDNLTLTLHHGNQVFAVHCIGLGW